MIRSSGADPRFDEVVLTGDQGVHAARKPGKDGAGALLLPEEELVGFD